MQSSWRRKAVRNLAVLVAALGPLSSPLAAEKARLAIKGYDPVAYFQLGKATRGQPGIEYVWDERRYLFSSAEHRELFRADPVRYAPQFPNFCAISLARGEVVDANPEYWVISDGKLYMFGKAMGPELFRQNTAEIVVKSNGNRRLVQ